MGQRGQSVILFCLILSVVIVTLLGSIMISIQSFNKGVTRLKTRILGYQATIQISQVIQQGRATAKRTPTCVVPGGGLTPVTANGFLMCLPMDKVCVNNQFRFCIAKNPGYSITKGTPVESTEDVYASIFPSFNLDFSFIPKAYAQLTAPKVWLPNLVNPPTASVSEAGFPADKAAICGGNAECFRIRICTNGSDNCPNANDYFDTLVAILTSK